MYQNQSKWHVIDESYEPKILIAERKTGLFRKVSLNALNTIAEAEPNDKAIVDRRVMVLYSGGTIGMLPVNQGSYEPVPNMFLKALRRNNNLNDQSYIDEQYSHVLECTPMALPPLKGSKQRIVYWVFEYDPLLDSSDITFDDWVKIATDIHTNYDTYDAFVVLHGTDTLGYTASALSFMLENLAKPVILTGAQIPLCEARSDGLENFIGALIFAGTQPVPEVTVFFNNRLFRGNRTSKIDSSALDAFNSANLLPLGYMGISAKLDLNLVLAPPRKQYKFKLFTGLVRNISILRIFPSIPIECVKAFLTEPMEGVVLQTYGAGNVPSKRTDILEELSRAIERGVIIVNCTQCPKGEVDQSIYTTGSILKKAGVISGFDMSTECALCKLAYVLGQQNWDLEKKRQMMQLSLRGSLNAYFIRLRPAVSFLGELTNRF